jgi:GMP synthase (glutamine-hydrolysing)
MTRRPLLIYLAGAPPEPVASVHGDFARWFRALADNLPVELEVRDGPAGQRPPPARELAGIVITGSPASLTAPEPWMEEAIALVRSGAEAGTPVLGVCFGHQVIGAAFGAEVVRNPAGWEMGTHDVELTPAGRADPLFRGLPACFAVNFSHQDAVAPQSVSQGNGLEILARNPRAEVQALAAGDAVRGVQFHPEFSGDITRAYVQVRGEALRADAEARGAPDEVPERLLERIRDTPNGRLVFEQFVKNFVLRG